MLTIILVKRTCIQKVVHFNNTINKRMDGIMTKFSNHSVLLAFSCVIKKLPMSVLMYFPLKVST